jgi:hypothetical protein
MQELGEDLIAVLRVLKSEGGTDCTGTCHHRHPGEFHCHVFGKMVNLSSQGIKNRLLKLMRMGLVERQRIERASSTPMIRFIISDRGEALLTEHDVK